ncbi:hypothetical protein AZOA_08920 [Azoarcus sp. Aa7]|nr:hypothetical protein [Azoarcus sp. Aa7]
MTNKKINSERAAAGPTKRFFIDMLTRDIDLMDAILDLLDNCVDGVQRTRKPPTDATKPYAGYWAKISFGTDRFSIEDNCGGIPFDLARRYAFMMGRPKEEDEADADIPTVGMYGIGMKRAIFKMGRNAIVKSYTKERAFSVSITPKWMSDDSDWELDIENIRDSRRPNLGTEIVVTQLNTGIAQRFAESGVSSFGKDLYNLVSHHFSFIIRKGFRVFINDEEIFARQFSLLWSEDDRPKDERIEPYLYRSVKDGVEISMAVGFHSQMLTDDELDEEQKTKRSREDAGWTIICNDRVVVYNDKTRLTGWGEAGVPSYHSQFIGIAGVVVFRSNDAWKLPVTTTKRGVDTSSDVFLYIKDYMRDGLKRFTNHTNTWKGNVEAERQISGRAKPVQMEDLLFGEKTLDWTNVQNRIDEKKYVPSLAVPKEHDPVKIIRFGKSLSEIKDVAYYLFEDEDVAPGDVGKACFDAYLKKARS